MASAATLFYVSFSWVTASVIFILVFSLFRNFLRKKTTGTLLLFAAYLLIALGATIGSLVYTLEAFTDINQTRIIIGIFQSLATVTPLFALVLIYIFSCRHILKDNELTKTITSMIVSGFIAFVVTIYLLGVYGITDQTNEAAWWYLNTNEIGGTELYNIATQGFVISLFTMLIQVYINIRIAARSFILGRRTDKVIRKRGLQMIGWGLIVYLVAGIIISLEIGIPWQDGSHMPTMFWSIRKIVFLASYILLYLGWIMPDWFRRRIRGKTWFEARYKQISKVA